MGFLNDLRSLRHAWNVFKDETLENKHTFQNSGFVSMPSRQDRPRSAYGNERSIVDAIYNRIAIDVASVAMRHVRLDEDNRYVADIEDGLNNCLTVEANTDQAARHFMQNIVSSMCHQGVIAVVPVDTTLNPAISGSYDIKTMRVGEIVGFHPQHVRVRLYDERDGQSKEITVEKRLTAIPENPFFDVMNKPNSTLQRLIRKINLLDTVDERHHSGKLDIIIQLPYVVKTETRRSQAEQRRVDLEDQLTKTKYGVAYTDGSEKVIQLNRPVENNLLEQIEKLKVQLYGELGLTPEVMNGTADEKTMLNYYNRTVEPILGAIAESMRRTFLTKTARAQKQSIMYFRDPFKLVPMEVIAEISDKFTRNEIMSANEIRQAIGVKPSSDPKADELRNSNMPQPNEQPVPSGPDSNQQQEGDSQNGRR